MLARQARVSGRARDVCRNMSTSAAKYLDILARLARVSGRARDVSRNMSSAATDQGTVALDQQEIYSLTEKVLVAAGASREHASAVAEVVMQAERGDDTPYARHSVCRLLFLSLSYASLHSHRQRFRSLYASLHRHLQLFCSRWLGLPWTLPRAWLRRGSQERQSAWQRAATIEDYHAIPPSLRW